MTITTEYLETPAGRLEVTMRNSSAIVKFPGSKPGTFYDVTVTRSFVSCTCKAAQFGKSCRHATSIRKVLEG